MRLMVFLLTAGTLAAGALGVRFFAADAPVPPVPPSFEVPYLLSPFRHLVVRARVNGRGPLNLVIDSGAPTIYLSKAVTGPLRLRPDPNGWSTLDRVEIEGGVRLTNVRCGADEPFQLAWLNKLRRGGAELHGVLGYTFLARFRIELDLARDRMRWTRLDWEPPVPARLPTAASLPSGIQGLEEMVKRFGDRGKHLDPVPRGWLGIELAEVNGAVEVTRVFDGGPAAKAGLKPGDRLVRVSDRPAVTIDSVMRAAAQVVAGAGVSVRVARADQTLDLNVEAGEGL